VRAAGGLAHAHVTQPDGATYVLVPLEEYEGIVKAELARSATAKLQDPSTEWVDFEDFKLELAGTQITAARKARGLTQAQLGQKLSLPQSQISRLERNPDRTTVRTLKRVARALGVDVRALVS